MRTNTAKQWNATAGALLAIGDGAGRSVQECTVPSDAIAEDLSVYRTLMDESRQGILLCDAHSRCLRANRTACGLLDASWSALRGQTIEEIFLHSELAAHDPVESGGEERVSEVFRGNLWLEVGTFWLPGYSLAVNIRDISEYKKLQAQLMETHKIQEMGRLAGRIVHDFNNIIMIVSGQTEILLENVPDLPGFRKPLEQILKAARRGAALTSRLLEYGPL